MSTARNSAHDSRRTLIAATIAYSVLLPSCAPVPRFGPQAAREAPKAEAVAMARSSNAFALALYSRLAGGGKNDNLLFAPASVHTVLLMAYAGAGGDTAGQMRKSLRLTLDDATLHPATAALVRELGDVREAHEGGRAPELVVANAIWGNQHYPFDPGYLEVIKTHYGAPPRALDFQSRPEEASSTINSWVSKQTRGRIKDLVPLEAITPLTRLLLTNAVYFKSDWLEPFAERATRERPFYLLNGRTTQAPMMHRTGDYSYGETAEIQILRMPYAGDQLSMLVLLPKQRDGVKALEAALAADRLQAWLEAARTEKVEVAFPKFTFTRRCDLREPLIQMGMPNVFDDVRADFSGMTQSRCRELFVTDVLHEAFVAVDEKGTEAAASTAMIASLRANVNELQRRPKSFVADHPFVFLIQHNSTGLILFLGRVTDPRAHGE